MRAHQLESIVARRTHMLVEVNGLSKFYGAFQALKDVTVAVKPGCVGLLGPNGAGKSTLIRTLLGLLDFQAGQARVLGRDVRSDLMAVRQRIGYMPEQETLFGGMSGLDMVAFAGELSGLTREDAFSRAHEMLDYAVVGEERYRDVETYSTGMKQRAKLAQALVHGPELVFLDEPTNGLDPLGREEMLGIIDDLANAGVNVLLSSHLLRDVERVCDSVILMSEGEVVHYGSLAEFKSGEADQVEIEVRGGGGLAAFAESLRATGLEVQPHSDAEKIAVTLSSGDDLDRIWQIAASGDYEVRHLKPMSVSLEAAFVRFMEDLLDRGPRKPEGRP